MTNTIDCGKCNNKIWSHKSHITCCICSLRFHPKCAKLTPNDALILQSMDLLRSWMCTQCLHSALPIGASPIDGGHQIARKTASISKFETTCHVCRKLGNNLKMNICWLCENRVHPKCSLEALGCRRCHSEIFPNFVPPSTSKHSHHSSLFNPYQSDNEIGYVGRDPLEEIPDDWESPSSILRSCKYRSQSAIKPPKDGELQIFSANIRSLTKNITAIIDNLSFFSRFDIICLNETNCNPANLPFGGQELFLEGFHPPHIQRPSRASDKGGGLAIYINKRCTDYLNITLLEHLTDCSNAGSGEFLTLEIHRENSKNIIVSNYYRSPNSDPLLFLSRIDSILSNLHRHRNKIIVIAGDGNLNLLEYGKSEACTKFVNKLSELGFAPLISRPTRITDHSATLIDHIFTNSCQHVTKSGVISDMDLSDHLGTFVTLLADKIKVNKMFEQLASEARPITAQNTQNFADEIENADWSFLLEIADADQKFEKFYMEYMRIYNNCFPLKSRKKLKERDKTPWLLDWLRCACARKNRLYRKFVQTPSPQNKSNYTRMKKFVEKHIRLAKNRYYEQYMARYSNDCKKQWQLINQLLNRSGKSKMEIRKIEHHGSTVTNREKIAKTFNEYFTNIAQKLKDATSISQAQATQPNLSPSSKCGPDMGYESVTKVEISSIIKSLKVKATSDSGIAPLKAVVGSISHVLQHIVTASLEQGVFPTHLKTAKVIPLFKTGSRTDVSNYRPISLLPAFSKIYEKIMLTRLTDHLKKNKILYSSQYGFRSSHSCDHTILEAQNTITNALERKKVAALLLLDFSKAFDMVDHSILLQKLEHYGVRGNNLKWFTSYLHCRKQHVHVNNTTSPDLLIKHGVPQGSNLGPTLFLIYINDLPAAVPLAKFFMFADDSNLVVSADTPEELEIITNQALFLVNKWVEKNGLKLNVGKTKLLFFTNKEKSWVTDIRIQLNGTHIQATDHAKFLGVIIDSNLNWKYHIHALAAKVSRNAGILYKLRGLLPHKALKNLYCSFIESHLLYCATTWGTSSQNVLKPLFSAQKKGIRALKNNARLFYDAGSGANPSHTKPIFAELQLLALPNIVAKSLLCIMQKCRLKVAPINIQALFPDTTSTISQSQTAHYNTRSSKAPAKIFQSPCLRLERSKKQAVYVGPNLYNYIVPIANSFINEYNTSNKQRHLKDYFFNSFKKSITRYLLHLQNLPDGNDEWSSTNFVLETINNNQHNYLN